jgi:hypothetical protein
MSSTSGVGNGVSGRGIVRRRGGRGGRGIGRAGLGAVEVVWRPRCLYVQDCTFTARLPCQWLIRDV